MAAKFYYNLILKIAMKSYIILKTVTLISVLVSCGFSVIGIVRPELLVSPALGHDHIFIYHAFKSPDTVHIRHHNEAKTN